MMSGANWHMDVKQVIVPPVEQFLSVDVSAVRHPYP
jgi:hypothetical protein